MGQTAVNKNPAVFTKRQIVNANRYMKYVDFLSGVLRDDEMYTLDQVDKMISNFYGKGKSEQKC